MILKGEEWESQMEAVIKKLNMTEALALVDSPGRRGPQAKRVVIQKDK